MWLLNVLVIFILVSFVVALGPLSGPVGPIRIYEIGICPDNLNELGFNITLNTDVNDVRSVSFTADLPFELSEDTEISLVIDKWDLNMWHRGFYTNDGVLQDLIGLYANSLWGKVRDSIEPPLDNSRTIPPGHYELNNYMDSYKSLDVPLVFYGRFKVYLTVTNNDEDVLCIMSELETHDP